MNELNFSRRKFLSGLAVAGMGAVIAACAPKETPAPAPVDEVPAPVDEAPAPVVKDEPTPVPAPKEKVVVRWQGGGGATIFPVTEQLIKDHFAPDHPHIDLQVEPNPDAWVERTLTAMIAGTAPDIVQTWGNIYWQWTERDMFLDLQPFVDRDMTDEDIDEFLEYQWDGLLFKGVRVGMPRYLNLILFTFNKDMFDEYGVDYPPEDGDWTRDDQFEMMAELTEAARSAGDDAVWASMIPMHSSDRFWGPVKSFGGEVVDEMYGKRCMLDMPESIEGLRWDWDMKWTYNYHAQPPQIEMLDPRTSFMNRMSMSMDDGIGGYGTWHQRWYHEAGINYDFRHIAKGPRGHRVTLGTTDCWNIWSGTKAPEESWEVMEWLVGDFFQSKWNIETQGAVPVRKPLVDAWVRTMRELRPELEDVRLETVPEILEWGYAEDQPLFCDSLAAYEVIRPALEKLYVVGDVAPEDIVDDLVAQVNATQVDCQYP